MAAEKLIFHRVASDVCGNPRYVVDYSNLLAAEDIGTDESFDAKFERAAKRANSIGGRVYTGRAFASAFVFQSYSIYETARHISRVTGREFVGEKS